MIINNQTSKVPIKEKRVIKNKEKMNIQIEVLSNSFRIKDKRNMKINVAKNPKMVNLKITNGNGWFKIKGEIIVPIKARRINP